MSSTSTSVLRADQIWLDGKLVKWDEGHVHVMTHALHYGLGVFEGIRAYKTHDGRLAVFRLREHIQRLLDSAHICMLKMPYTEDELVEACLDLLRKQKDLFANGAYLRPVAFMGDGAMGLGAVNPTRVAVTAWDWGAYLGDKGIREGIRAKVSSFTRLHVNVNMVRGKISGQYVNSILAKREVVLAGYDEAILLDISGFVAEASGENIFMVNKKGVIKTPPLSSPILDGITRDTVLKILRDSGRTVDEVTFTRDALYICNEIFFTGTAAEITPVREVDDRTVGTGKPGPIGTFVQDMYFRTVRGMEPRYAEWLTYV
ncbi:branched-chain amino acid transaminase [Myxococcus sp. CA051A]|uniref:Branched-chain-amino-acid aminotransferase n=1 Tax=Myxococcus llanfairpwllgwyngyllgogerychwyrndrobwllllantysiliogogogochensis TaxID=2590453 RepID=A0A540WQA4_9BACT|nr:MULTISPECIES: branched-chain amino acid transaminase [Myxococcus]NTX03646.1 branched-chain amino acid transaminase [Myxococcus sp. CA040A]NTX14190.1 branched-chain amino acid transaminase [Myxococcus sp. CA056]NTX56436.1 branched-chain amino acid transaminase [Myxococcus sp. CA039A]NTX62172.1 branched-chain amino acid transaminase [Myxococcus sp. CA051A]TQF11198.1 branched-chain amino acid transaminase [Myxococcus llanfairpwllgwyngyllgogerychwyrndrobwllllantysiliogogogochensis]